MTNYEGYEITDCAARMNCYIAYKYNAKIVDGIRFSHMFYFYYTDTHANATINGRGIKIGDYSFDNDVYQANLAEGGCVITNRFTSFLVLKEEREFQWDGTRISREELTNYKFV